MDSEFKTSTASTYCSPALEDAWRRFGDFDKNANIAQKRFLKQRKWIIMLGVIVTTLAVVDFMLDRALDVDLMLSQDLVEETSLLFRIILELSATQEQAVEIATWVDRIMNIIIIIIPILISILVAGAVKFNMGINWVMLRSASESIKHEIFRYRTQVGIYSPDYVPPGGSKPETRDVTLARRIKQIGKRVMETQVNMSELEIYDYKKEGLPPVYGVAPGDDGFSDLTADQYIHWRIEDQFDYYRSKAKKLAKELQRSQWLIYIFGGLGTLLAAIQLEIWVAVTSSLVAALGSFLEFKRVETNLIGMNLAASDLYDIRAWWRALSDSAKQQTGNKATLVKSAEAVIQSENASWLTEMREALSEVYGEEEGDEKDADVNEKSAIAVLPESVNQMSDAAAASSSAFRSVARGEGGSWLAAMQATLAQNAGGTPENTVGADAVSNGSTPGELPSETQTVLDLDTTMNSTGECSESAAESEARSFEASGYENDEALGASAEYADEGRVEDGDIDGDTAEDDRGGSLDASSDHAYGDNVADYGDVGENGSTAASNEDAEGGDWLNTPTAFDESLSSVLEDDYAASLENQNGSAEDSSSEEWATSGTHAEGDIEPLSPPGFVANDASSNGLPHASTNGVTPLDSTLQMDLPDGYEEDLKIFSDSLAEESAPAPFQPVPEANLDGEGEDEDIAVHLTESGEFVPSPFQQEPKDVPEGEQGMPEVATSEEETSSL